MNVGGVGMKKLLTGILSFLLVLCITVPSYADEDNAKYIRLEVDVPEDETEWDTGTDIWDLIAKGKLNLTITAYFKDKNGEYSLNIHPSQCDIYPDTILAEKNSYSIYYKDRDSGTRKHATFRLTGTGRASEVLKQNIYNGKWYMQASDGTYYMNTWKWVDGSWYYFDENGYLLNGWQQIGGKMYYLDRNNYRLQMGWYIENGVSYYLDPADHGAMCTGWAKINDIWYRFKENGTFASGWVQDNNQWYYINPDGTMYAGWLQDKYIWYYLTPETGAAATGWKEIGGKWYYFASNGAMLVNTVIDGYYVDSSGMWIP